MAGCPSPSGSPLSNPKEPSTSSTDSWSVSHFEEPKPRTTRPLAYSRAALAAASMAVGPSGSSPSSLPLPFCFCASLGDLDFFSLGEDFALGEPPCDSPAADSAVNSASRAASSSASLSLARRASPSSTNSSKVVTGMPYLPASRSHCWSRTPSEPGHSGAATTKTSLLSVSAGSAVSRSPTSPAPSSALASGFSGSCSAALASPSSPSCSALLCLSAASSTISSQSLSPGDLGASKSLGSWSKPVKVLSVSSSTRYCLSTSRAMTSMSWSHWLRTSKSASSSVWPCSAPSVVLGKHAPRLT